MPFGTLDVSSMGSHLVNVSLQKNWVSEGEQVKLFEQEFATKFGFKHAVMTSSGTTAGVVAWSAIREMSGKTWGEGQVITPACAFVATASCILSAGLIPRFVDIDLATLNMETERASGFAKDVVGCQFVAQMGKLEGIDYWRNECTLANPPIPLLIDACEAHGATWQGQGISQLCDVATFSFYAAHIIVAGEGGMVCTNNGEIAELCLSIKSHGRPVGTDYFSFDRMGTNAKANDLTAAIGRGSLGKFEETFRRRREIRQSMLDGLGQLRDRLIFYPDADGEVIAPHAFPIVFRGRAATMMGLSRALENASVQSKTLFGSLPVQHAAFGHLGYGWGDFPVAEHVGRAGIHWGCHEAMTDEDVDLICDIVRKAVSG